ncbi:polysaccharide lyase family 7 protein [Seonamhaeicola maritimus]|uniref:polysaccharide lyase family 7 protein n=1 Tax=Seonamhaeicola maritimus TaxID=2591822 RepID=UPI002495903B|nr:polysaccharide lyase family 7 protein [Seonamhaeicola maritimus]
MKKYIVYFFSCFVLLNCSGGDSNNDVLEEEQEQEEQGNIIPLIPNEGIPSPFNLFTVIDDDVERKDFNSVSKWYEEFANKQIFKLFTGDEFVGERKHARTEAGQGLKWKQGTEWHTFEATMTPSGKLNETYTIAQLFAGCCGPQLRVEVRSSGRINVGSRANGNIRISTDEDWATGTKSFKIKIRSNGKDMEVYFNDELKFTGISEESTFGNIDALYHFRWGVYSNNKMIKNLSNTVTNITRE